MVKRGTLSTSEKLASLNPAQRSAGARELATQTSSQAAQTVSKAKSITRRPGVRGVTTPTVIEKETAVVKQAVRMAKRTGREPVSVVRAVQKRQLERKKKEAIEKLRTPLITLAEKIQKRTIEIKPIGKKITPEEIDFKRRVAMLNQEKGKLTGNETAGQLVMKSRVLSNKLLLNKQDVLRELSQGSADKQAKKKLRELGWPKRLALGFIQFPRDIVKGIGDLAKASIKTATTTRAITANKEMQRLALNLIKTDNLIKKSKKRKLTVKESLELKKSLDALKGKEIKRTVNKFGSQLKATERVFSTEEAKLVSQMGALVGVSTALLAVGGVTAAVTGVALTTIGIAVTAQQALETARNPTPENFGKLIFFTLPTGLSILRGLRKLPRLFRLRKGNLITNRSVLKNRASSNNKKVKEINSFLKKEDVSVLNKKKAQRTSDLLKKQNKAITQAIKEINLTLKTPRLIKPGKFSPTQHKKLFVKLKKSYSKGVHVKAQVKAGKLFGKKIEARIGVEEFLKEIKREKPRVKITRLEKQRRIIRRQQRIEQKLKRGLQVKAPRENFIIRNGKKAWPFLDINTGNVRFFTSRTLWFKAVKKQSKITKPIKPKKLIKLRTRAERIRLEKQRRILRKQQKIEQKLKKGLQVKAPRLTGVRRKGRIVFPFKDIKTGKVRFFTSRKKWLRAVKQQAKAKPVTPLEIRREALRESRKGTKAERLRLEKQRRLLRKQEVIEKKLKKGIRVKVLRTDFIIRNGRKAYPFKDIKTGKVRFFTSRTLWFKAVKQQAKKEIRLKKVNWDIWLKPTPALEKVLESKAIKIKQPKIKIFKPVVRKLKPGEREVRVGRQVLIQKLKPPQRKKLITIQREVKKLKTKQQATTIQKKSSRLKQELKSELKQARKVRSEVKTRVLSLALILLREANQRAAQKIRTLTKLKQIPKLKEAQEIKGKQDIIQKIKTMQKQSIQQELRRKQKLKKKQKLELIKVKKIKKFKLEKKEKELEELTKRVLTKQMFIYIPDLYSRVFGVKARPKERAAFLRAGRVFTGIEARPLLPARLIRKTKR